MARAGRDWLERPPLSIHPSTTSLRFARGLADAFVSASWREEELIARGQRAVDRGGRWLRPLVRRLLKALGEGSRPPLGRIVTFLENDPGLLRAVTERRVSLSYGVQDAPAMWPAAGPPTDWDVPPIRTPGELAALLGLTPGELDWFADPQGRGQRVSSGPLGHYVYTWRRKANGSARLIESPKPRLKTIQRRLLDEVIANVPTHEAAHGFHKGRSVRTFAGPHVGRRVVLKLDLRDFFPTVSAARVVALWRTAGYPEPVAGRLAGLCTNRVPGSVWDDPFCPARGPDAWRTRRLFFGPHLPQGAPTSPALANLAAYRLDARLTGLAATAGASYTRYADDLAFSGGRDFERTLRRFHVSACAVALEEGFVINTRKTRVMREGTQQRLAGVVVNEHLNVARADFDRLKAVLHNCLKFGPEAQNRGRHPDFRAHLAGRVAHVAMLNSVRGAKLHAMLDAIAWP